jgi:hypothetical protein
MVTKLLTPSIHPVTVQRANTYEVLIAFGQAVAV